MWNIPEKFYTLARACSLPLYLVGGSVRDFLLGFPPSDFDLASPMTETAFAKLAEGCGFTVKAVYGRTGTVKIVSEGLSAEYTRFRTDSYDAGHAPASVRFTDDIIVDALRRDLTANAIYFDLKKEQIEDPLGGAEDLKRGRLKMTRESVFEEDGLRLMRLARIAAETGLTPDENSYMGAKNNAKLIREIAPERIFHELELLLCSDLKHGLKDGPYRGLRILKDIGVLSEIMPELACGDGMDQRRDFHKYDVLEHSFRCVMYAPPEIRFAALLHDVGKPFCKLRDGNTYAHAEEGARIAEEILARLKAPNRLKAQVSSLVAWHMLDLRLDMREAKVRRHIAEIGPLFGDFLSLKQADFSACGDDLSPAPAVVKWRAVREKMKEEGAPLALGDLKIGGNDLLALGVPPQKISGILKTLFDECLLDGTKNVRERLVSRAAALVQK